MMISSDKANRRVAEVVAFGSRHRWAKYPCVAAVSAIYSAEFIRLKAIELGERIKASATAPFRPLAGRITAAALSFAVMFMALPFASINAYAEEPDAAAETQTETQAETDAEGEEGEEGEKAETSENTEAEGEETEEKAEKKDLPEAPEATEAKKTEKARTPEDIRKLVTVSGLAEDNFAYDIELNIPWLDRELTARFSEPDGIYEQVTDAFNRYGISTEDLNIDPVDIVIYANDNNRKMKLREGYSADITLPVADDMAGHVDDLKIVRLEDDGTMTILEGVLDEGNIGRTVTFNTSHFSVFAVVAYKDNVSTAENIASAAGSAAAGVGGEIAISYSNPVLDEDRRRFRKPVKKRVFRIKRIINERDLLL